MGLLGQDTYLEQDRYYHAILIFRAGEAPSTKDVSDLFTKSHIWWWDLGGGEDSFKGQALEWRQGYLKNVGSNVRPRLMASVLGAVLVAVEDYDVSGAVETLLTVLEEFMSVGPAGVDPSEGATMAAHERLTPGAQYAISVDWGKKSAPAKEVIISALDAIGIEVVSIDCGSINPLEDTGNPFGDIVNYFADYPAVATFFIKYNGTTAPTAKEIRNALNASAVYIPRTATYSPGNAWGIAKACGILEAGTHIAFLSSRTVVAAIETVDELIPDNPKKWLKTALYVTLGLSALYVGYRVYHIGWERREREGVKRSIYKRMR